MKDFKIGKYKHYKGGVYEVFAIGTHSETLEKLVLYRNQNGDIWGRPLEMFIGNVVVNGKEQKRFDYIK